MVPKGVNRVVIAVNDLEKSIEMYTKLLGGGFLDVSADAEPYGLRCAISFDAGIELCSPIPGRKSPAAAFLQRHGEGVMSVVYCVDDVDTAKAVAEGMGLACIAMIADYDQTKIDDDLEGRFSKYKEYMLDSTKSCGYGVVIGEITPKTKP